MTTTILLVEDNEFNRILLMDILEHYGFTVLLAVDGEEGIRMAREHQPDLILMDIQLPVIDGLSAGRLLKQDRETAGIKIIAVTSFAMKGDRERCREAGFDDYVAKPFDTRTLPEIIRRVLDDAHH